ncbi:CusA/CzcA family heavy metal efflux RND transporter [bacterium]|nr:CusA/CzcA family heavy metal efflux RND transporter [bacterium]
MLDRILHFSIQRRWTVVAATLAVAALGARALWVLPIDAVPDITGPVVQINTVDPSLSPLDIERQVTFPVETALAGIPGLERTRSLSRNGFSQVSAVFRDGTDIYFARQQIGERLLAVRDRLPASAEPRLGPISSGLGDVFMWTVAFAHPDGRGAAVVDDAPGWQPDGAYRTPEGERLRTPIEQAAYLRTVQDWIIRPQLQGVPDVAGIDAIGGFVKQVVVEPDVRQLAAHGLGFADLVAALEANNLSTGAGVIEHHGAAYVVRASARIESVDALADIAVAERGGTPIRLTDLARVSIGGEPRTGSASQNGEEVVSGTAMMLLGANSRTVARAVAARLTEIQRTLPPDVVVTPVLDRSQLVDAVIRTVATNLLEGAILVIAVLFALLGNLRAAVITALAIPLSMLLTAIGMVQTRTSGNLMSLGAIDFGLIVDGAVIIVENCLRVLGERRETLGRPLTLSERLAAVGEASTQVRGATAFGEAIIILVYVPLLFLTGVEGRMFRPMAMTVIFALVAAFVLSLTFVPAMVAIWVREPARAHTNPVIALVSRAYRPTVRWTLRLRWLVVGGAVAVCAGAVLLFNRLGQEFVPTLGELDLLVHAARIPGTGVEQSTRMQRDLERAFPEFPEVALVFSRTGTAEMAADPMPPYLSDTFVVLKPRAEWPDPDAPKEAVRERVAAALGRIPGNRYEYTQPIQMRFNELLAGVRGDLAVKLFGDDFAVLQPAAAAVAAAIAAIPGAADVRVEPVRGAPVLSIDVDRAAIARYGLSVTDVHAVVAAGVGGHRAGLLFEGDRRFDIVVRLPEAARQDLDVLERLPILLSHEDRPRRGLALGGDDVGRAPLRFVPLGALASLRLEDGPNQISRENGKRRVVVQANVRGRDLGSFVADAQARVEATVHLPPGTWLEWGGQFESLLDARRRLAVVVPLCFLVILLLLYASFGSFADALIIFSGVPLALSGGVATLWLRDMPFSITAAVGFIALSGVAVLNGLVLISFIRQLRREGAALEEAITQGALTRLRPVLMTALVASLGFLPMALATGTGAEVQRPLATVVIGGLVTSTALTLVVLPALYRIVWSRQG